MNNSSGIWLDDLYQTVGPEHFVSASPSRCRECGHATAHQSATGCIEVLLLIGQRQRGSVLCGCTHRQREQW